MLPLLLGIGTVAGFGLFSLGCRARETHPESGEGKAARETVLTFEDESLSPERREDLLKILAGYERLPRSFNLGLFRNFNGWTVITTEEMDRRKPPSPTGGKVQAYFHPEEERIFIKSRGYAHGHEFGHFVDHDYSLSFGERASDTREWSAISCFHHPEFSSENCVDEYGNRRVSSSEEFANISSLVLANPLGAFVTYSVNPNALRQALFVAGVAGFPQRFTEEVLKKQIQSPSHASIQGPSKLALSEVALIDGKYLSFRMVRPLGEGPFLLMKNSREILVSNSPEEPRSKLVLPEAIDGEKEFQLDSTDETFVLFQNDAVYRGSAQGFRKWANAPEMPDGRLAIVEGTSALLSQQRYVLFNAKGKGEKREYPPSLAEELAGASGHNVVREGTERFLWIREAFVPGYGKVSKLYRLKDKNGGLEFKKEWEIPSPVDFGGALSSPLPYRGNWYLAVHLLNSHLSDLHNAGKERVWNEGYPAFYRIENGGRRIAPVEIRYPRTPEGVLLHDRFSQHLPYTYQVLGGRLAAVYVEKGSASLSLFDLAESAAPSSSNSGE
ncbi:MAG: hypothetical protein U1F57_12275 [bacterium]